MQAEKVFKRYDLRGKYPEELDDEFAKRLGSSLACFAKNDERFQPQIVVCRDNKDSSKFLKEELIEGILSTGVEVVDIGTGPTDFAAYAGSEKQLISVQVTSSHMQLGFNGFKFIYPEGNGFVNEDLNKVKEIFRENDFEDGEGVLTEEDFFEDYLDDLASFAKIYGDSWEGKDVVVDSLGGSTFPVVKEVLNRLGADVYSVDEELEGLDVSEDFSPYRDPPNPKEGQLEELMNLVDERGADLGLSFDMDGDRVAVYHGGDLVSGDEVFAILASLIDGDVVGSIDTSDRVRSVVSSRNNDLFLTRVGDPFVMDKAVKEGVDLAGEPNRHYSFLDFVPYNSGSLAGIILAGLDLESVREEVPGHKIFRESIEVEDKERTLDEIGKYVEENSDIELVSDLDGYKFSLENCSVLVRPSGSSAKIRFVLDGVNSDLESEYEGLISEIGLN